MRQVIFGGAAVCAYLGGVCRGDERLGWLLLAGGLFFVASFGLAQSRAQWFRRFESMVSGIGALALAAVLWAVFAEATPAAMLAVFSFLGAALIGLCAFFFLQSDKRWKLVLPGMVFFLVAAGLTAYLLFLG